MINEILSINGYWIYVCSAFSFTLISFASLYMLTKLQLIKEKRKFVYKFGTLSTEKARAAQKQRINQEILLDTLSSKI